MKKSPKTDLITGIVLALFSIFYFCYATQVQVFSGGGSAINARTVPYMWAVALLVLSVCLILREVRHPKTAEGNAEGNTGGFRWWLSENYAVVGTFVALALYATALKPVGYMLSTTIYLVIQTMLLTEKARLNKRTLLLGLIVAILFTLISDFLFVRILSVPLPKGLFGF